MPRPCVLVNKPIHQNWFKIYFYGTGSFQKYLFKIFINLAKSTNQVSIRPHHPPKTHFKRLISKLNHHVNHARRLYHSEWPLISPCTRLMCRLFSPTSTDSLQVYHSRRMHHSSSNSSSSSSSGAVPEPTGTGFWNGTEDDTPRRLKPGDISRPASHVWRKGSTVPGQQNPRLGGGRRRVLPGKLPGRPGGYAAGPVQDCDPAALEANQKW